MCGAGRMDGMYRPVDKAEGFAWCFTCEGKDENDASYNSALDKVMLALKDCTVPSSLEQRLCSLRASAVSSPSPNRNSVAAIAGVQAAEADARAVDCASRAVQMDASEFPEPKYEYQADGSWDGDLTAIQEAWNTRNDWAPPNASGLDCRNDGDEAALWCSLVTQHANLLHRQRASAGETRIQRFSELQVFDCLAQLSRSTAECSNDSRHHQQNSARTHGCVDKDGQGVAASAAATAAPSRIVENSNLQGPGHANGAFTTTSPASPSAVIASAADDETTPVVLESSPNGEWTLVFPVLGVGYFGWAVGDAVRVLLASVAAFLRDCRAPKLRLVTVVPQAGDEIMTAVKKEQDRSTSTASLDGRFQVRKYPAHEQASCCEACGRRRNLC